MQHTLPCPPSAIDDSEPFPSFNVVIAYEDLETGKHAKRIYDYLADTLRGQCELSSQMWKFDVLRIPKLREIASADAAAADLVLVSCHGNDLPEEAKEWMESWAAGPNAPLALVALFDQGTEDASQFQAVRDYLAATAERGNMEFFAHPNGCSLRRHGGLEMPDSQNFSQRTLNALAGVVQRELPNARWSPFD